MTQHLSRPDTVPDSEPPPTGVPGLPEPLDIVGIGALNLDYIADTSGDPGLRRLLADGGIAVGSGGPMPLTWGGESAVDERTIYGILELVDASSLSSSLGGSAFNAIYALAQMRLDLRLGYVGVAGRVPLRGQSSIAELARWGVDTCQTYPIKEAMCGVCFSLMDAGERTLLTHGGANARMGAVIEENFEAIVSYLTRARVVHVTSFLDPETPSRLLRLLTMLRAASPNVAITFDPGHVWSAERSVDVLGMVALADYLLLNAAELALMGRASPGESDEKVAARVLDLMASAQAVVLVKRPAGITLYRKDGDRIAADVFPQQPLPTEEIRDATGAGDVFAAGLLSVLGSTRLQLELGALLGMRLARQKLRYVGSQGHASFAALTRSFIAAREAERYEDPHPGGIFVAHGGDPQWLAVKEYLEREFAAPVHSFESGVWGSSQVSSVLEKYLNLCGTAICVLTTEDLVEHGRGFARQNVVHEVGLFQGRYGQDRVIILVEEGCRFLPDIGATPPLVFPRNSIKKTFWSLREELLRKGVRIR
ncbi:PfkB family carbohydrate kinase [Frankia sp. Ag45/Mut15]|uniref:PfkB family carbohydrate kinase n=1 Tax=Frankia umida TaxID=573489 RepID=A0ABT0JSL0_9ACTN|nr:PfkB family carbohydrate kinase [Frankia umida]MCK9874545.1 PfkB family carbohydrate kinase [Frankia umida]